MDLEQIDWDRLARLRERFIEETGKNEDYWRDRADLAVYDATFAQRIAWKWLSVLRELELRKWQPVPMPIIDFGCGSGVATRTLLDYFPSIQKGPVFSCDRSTLAMDYATEQLNSKFPEVHAEPLTIDAIQPWMDNKSGAAFTLVVSHVLNELTPVDKQILTALLQAAHTILIVEPGTSSVGRVLVELRDKLLPTHTMVAPCTHQQHCGMLKAGNEGNWCHHYGRTPFGVFADSGWVKFGQMVGIDLRSLVYSFLVAEKKNPNSLPNEDWERIVGYPREMKGYLKVINCNKDGVQEKIFQKRDGKADYKKIQKLKHAPIFKWQHEGDKIIPKDRLDQEGCHTSAET